MTAAKVCGAIGTLILIVIIAAAGSVAAAKLFGIQPMAILSGSMEPAYHVGGLVFIDTRAAPGEIAVGDAIAYNLTEDMVVTHRVVGIDPEAREFQTKGDANNAPDIAPVPFGSLIGKAVFHVPQAGYAIMNLPTRKGFAAGAVLAAILIALFAVPALLASAKGGKKADTAPASAGGEDAQEGP
ncbi:MAG: signal peptidase I [Clostridiales Family XIII bacterium]|jgi:signal peptidase|nr:signal peptidase I [Clostridiales Family XIII bacterium]